MSWQGLKNEPIGIVGIDNNGFISANNASQLTDLDASSITNGTIDSSHLPIATTSSIGAVSFDNVTLELNGSDQLRLTGSYNGQTIATTNQLVGQVILSYDPVNNISTDTVMLDSALINLNSKIDAVIMGINIKEATASSTGNINISNPGTAIFDSYTVSNGDIIFLHFQTLPEENGLYTFNGAASAMTRPSNMNTWSEVVGALVVVDAGTLYAGTLWLCTNELGGTIDVTPISFSEIATIYQSGNNINISGNIINTVSNPIFTSETLSDNTNQIKLGTGNQTTITMDSLSAHRIFTLPNASSNPIQPLASATANNWIEYIDSSGIQHLSQPSFSNISGTLAISQGGTNSSTTLNNNNLMYSSAGKIIELGSMTNGQIVIGSTSAAPVISSILGTTNQITVTSGAGSIQLALSPRVSLAAIALSTTGGGTLCTVNWSTGNCFTLTLSANCTFSFSNQIAGQVITIRLTNTASNFTVTWPAVKWMGGVTPTMSIGAVSDIYTFIYDGTNYFGNYAQNFS